MRKLIIITLFLIVLAATGCLKDTPSTDLSHEGTIIELIYPPAASNNGVGSGLEYFGGGSLLYNPTDISDTLTFFVNIAGTNTLSKSLSVTIAPDPNACLYNYSSDSITYLAMPDSLYTILNPTKTIAAGSRIDTFQIVFYPNKINLQANYMLAITCTNSGGYTLAGNFGHLYLHTIGNPIAGVYSWDYTRWNAADTTGVPFSNSIGNTTVFAPDNGTQIEVSSGYYNLPRYVLSFTNTGGVLSNFAVSLNSSDLSSWKAAGITLTNPPVILTADPINGIYRFMYKVKNASGPRTLID